MSSALLIIQIILAVLIVVAILLQTQGSGLGAAWGGGGETYHTRRGLEKVLFYASFVLIGLFVITSIVAVILT